MPGRNRRVPLGPLMGANGTRVTDRALQGTYMRGGYNVELRDGEWWTRQGEGRVSTSNCRLASVAWWWIFDVNRDYTVFVNPWYVLINDGSGFPEVPYSAAVTENVSVTNNSATATSSTTRVVGQLMRCSTTSGLYRVTARTGTTMTLDRPYEGSTNAARSMDFYDSLARNTAGSITSVSTGADIIGNAVVFEQLVTNSSTGVHAASPATTRGNLYLIVTSNQGCPVAIDLTAWVNGTPTGVLRTWFYNTALGTPAIVGANNTSDDLKDHGVYCEVYKGRLFIGAAADPNGQYSSRTVWYSQSGDFCRWHTGIAGQTAAPNFKTFDGEGNAIGGLATLQDDLIIHRDDTQVVGSITNSLSQPFSFRENNQGIGIRSRGKTNRIIKANGVHYVWTLQGPAIFDGRGVTPIAREAVDALAAMGMLQDRTMIRHVQHDSLRRRIYWFSDNSKRVPGALPATATVTYTSGVQVQNYSTVFVYDYVNNTFWFEDRPSSYGGGMASTTGTTNGNTLHLSRKDGTLVQLMGTTCTAGDAAHLTPETTTDNVVVNCQVETPWMDLGTTEQKRVNLVETLERSIVDGGSVFDAVSDAGLTGSAFALRCRVYTDYKNTAKGDGTVTFNAADSTYGDEVEYQQSPTLKRVFTYSPIQGRHIKLVFSNALSSGATTANYVQAPFRISDIYLEITDRSSTQPVTDDNSAQISE